MRGWLAGLLVLASAGAGYAQETPAAWTSALEDGYRVVPNVTYLTASGYEAKLDLYVGRASDQPRPTVIFIHGGGWVNGVKEGSVPSLLPWLAMGLNVVNVEYRLARIAHAPAAVEDCRCALRWVVRNAATYGIDTTRLVVTGQSAGGHLALMTGMLTEAAGLDRQCPGVEDLKVAAIVNWYGITDVNELLEGEHMKPYAVTWLGSTPDRESIATRVSPLTYVRAGLPPIFTIHGDADPTVPYSHGVRLHQALDRAGVPNELMTTPGGKHGFACCTLTEREEAYARIRTFLTRHGILAASPGERPMRQQTPLDDFAIRYTAAWCSQQAASVATFFAENGSLTINGGTPAVGRAAITAAAQGFMTAFPDMVVRMDRLDVDGERATYHWTLTGTNTGPGGTGAPVRISGHEEWRIGADGLIAESQGHFDAADYQRQLARTPGF